MKKIGFLLVVLFINGWVSPTIAQTSAAKEEALTNLLDTLKTQLETTDVREILAQIIEVQEDGIEDYPELDVRFRHLKANQLKRLGFIDSALHVMQEARLLIEQHKLDHRRAGNHLFTAGILKAAYRSKEALEHYRIAEALFREAEDVRNLVPCLTQITATLGALGQFEEAKGVAEEAIHLGEELQVPKVSIQIYNNVGLLYRNANDLLNCARMYFKGFEMAKAHALPTYATALAVNLSTVYERLCQYEKAIQYSKEAIYWSEQVNYKMATYKAMILSTNLSLLLGELDSAATYIQQLESSALVEKKSIFEPAIENLKGQLTATIMGNDDELSNWGNLFNTLQEKVGRLIFNGVPTGVEVCHSMQHGGPFPATTDGRFTSVGTAAIKRFARPVAFQNCPENMLPEELKSVNALGIWRMVDGEWTNQGL